MRYLVICYTSFDAGFDSARDDFIVVVIMHELDFLRWFREVIHCHCIVYDCHTCSIIVVSCSYRLRAVRTLFVYQAPVHFFARDSLYGRTESLLIRGLHPWLTILFPGL